MKRLRKACVGVLGLMSVFGLTTACGDMQDQPATVERSKKRIVPGKDTAVLNKLMKDIKFGFGERNPGVASISFDEPR